MPTTRLSKRLAGQAHNRQLLAIGHADAAARRVDRAIGTAWQSILDLLKRGDIGPGEARRYGLALFQGLRDTARRSLRHSFGRIASWGFQASRKAIVQTMPRAYLRRAARRKYGIRARESAAQLGRQHLCFFGPAAGDRRFELDYLECGLAAHTSLLEDESSPGAKLLATFLGDWGTLSIEDLLAQLDDPELSADEAKSLFAEILLPPPPREKIDTWLDRLVALVPAHGSRGHAPPEKLAGILADGYAVGKGPRGIAKDLLPYVNDVRVSAMRVARTWGMHVAASAQMDTHAELGDLVIGYQVHASLDKNTRPEHRARNGTIYWREPKAGQKGCDEMPRPPLEADGSTAWNCRCYLSPVLRPLD
jgi:SPP1 gp7 family putative phage head morphogenesis protein